MAAIVAKKATIGSSDASCHRSHVGSAEFDLHPARGAGGFVHGDYESVISRRAQCELRHHSIPTFGAVCTAPYQCAVRGSLFLLTPGGGVETR